MAAISTVGRAEPREAQHIAINPWHLPFTPTLSPREKGPSSAAALPPPVRILQ